MRLYISTSVKDKTKLLCEFLINLSHNSSVFLFAVFGLNTIIKNLIGMELKKLDSCGK